MKDLLVSSGNQMFIIQLTKLPTGRLPERDSVHTLEIYCGTSTFLLQIIQPYFPT